MLSLDQNKNYRAEFGLVFRSSAIFAVFPSVNLTISVLNYWKLKNGLEVALVATCRDMAGAVQSRHQLEFEGSVLNFSPSIREGSVEIEAFGNRNMRIPYAAIMGVYETDSSVSMVHSYARNHSCTEIEDGVAVLEGREACIGLRADEDVGTCAYFHNGNLPVAGQKATVIITNSRGEDLVRTIDVEALAPFQTVRFDFERLVEDYREHLDGEDGWAAIHFENMSAFPRLLIRWLHRPSGHVQVAHSNFDYSEFETNLLREGETAFFCTPKLPEDVDSAELVIYPRCTPGTYQVSVDNQLLVETGGGVALDFDAGQSNIFEMKRLNGRFPSRLVTAVRGTRKPDSLPFECSLGVVHKERPPKRFHWGVVSARLNSTICLTQYSVIYDEPHSAELTFKLYGAGAAELATRTMNFASVERVPGRIELRELFENADEMLGDSFGYLTLFSPWGGLFMFTSMEVGDSLTMEHSF